MVGNVLIWQTSGLFLYYVTICFVFYNFLAFAHDLSYCMFAFGTKKWGGLAVVSKIYVVGLFLGCLSSRDHQCVDSGIH